MAGEKILIIEDDNKIQSILRFSLQKAGFSTTSAINGFEGLAAIEIDLPDLIITDIMMPELDGHSFIDALKNRDETKNIPIIILSAKDSVNDILAGLESGARFYLTKPFKLNELVGHVKFILSRKK